MKKRELQELLKAMIKEALSQQYAGKTSHASKYRRSKLHPDEWGKDKAASQPIPPDETIRSQLGDLLVPILTNIEDMPALPIQVYDPRSKKTVIISDEKHKQLINQTAERLLLGHSVMKKDLMTLAKYIMASRVLPKLSLAAILRGLVTVFDKKTQSSS